MSRPKPGLTSHHQIAEFSFSFFRVVVSAAVYGASKLRVTMQMCHDLIIFGEPYACAVFASIKKPLSARRFRSLDPLAYYSLPFPTWTDTEDFDPRNRQTSRSGIRCHARP